MKIWRFYKKPKKDSSRRDYELYAITNKKKFAKEFMSTRNMDLFIMKKSEEEKDDWISFANDNLGAVLDYHDLQTCGDNDDDIETKKIKILMTYFEWQNCDSDQIDLIELQPEYWLDMPLYPIFNDKIIDALRNLEYVAAQRFYYGFYGAPNNLTELLHYINDNTETNMFEEDLEELDEDCDYAAPDIEVDELSLFIQTFKELLTE